MKIAADIVISVGKLLAQRWIKKYFTPERARNHRNSDIAWWRKYANKAKTSKGKSDDLIAEYLRIRFAIDS